MQRNYKNKKLVKRKEGGNMFEYKKLKNHV